jgi:regulator of cell morphogenesis and NO signaling
METFKQQTVGQIVAADYRKARVFENFNIDFCCGGDITLDEACKEQKIEPGKLLTELKMVDKQETAEDSYNHWPLDFLVDYIVANYHNKVREDLPKIKFYAEKVTEVHGQDHDELFDIYQKLLILNNEMITHMEGEEKWLFPFIKMLVRETTDFDGFDEDISANMIEMMQVEHEETGATMKKIRKMSKSYALPEDACPAYRVFYKSLETFETDLYKHVHLENNILFPKVLNIIQAG